MNSFTIRNFSPNTCVMGDQYVWVAFAADNGKIGINGLSYVFNGIYETKEEALNWIEYHSHDLSKTKNQKVLVEVSDDAICYMIGSAFLKICKEKVKDMIDVREKLMIN